MRSRDDKNHYIRVFPISNDPTGQPEFRSNENYDRVMEIMNPSDEQRKGYMGSCSMRSLKYFDVGRSFLADSLHNLYGGVMVSELRDLLLRSAKIVFYFCVMIISPIVVNIHHIDQCSISNFDVELVCTLILYRISKTSIFV